MKRGKNVKQNLHVAYQSEGIIFYNSREDTRDHLRMPLQQVMLDYMETCNLATKTFKANDDPKLQVYKPLLTFGDGNCALRALSMLCYGTQEKNSQT